MYRHAREPEDMPAMLLSQIAHFFQHYKDLENNKWVEVEGWANTSEAKLEITSAIERFQSAPDKPYF
jgi:inorganic pyrophosphatase